MAIQKPYADYDWYKTNYFGSAIPEEAFPSFAMKAAYLVDGLTAGNLQPLDAAPDCVKDAVCAAAEKLYQFEQSPAKEIKSENNDGYSVTYADTSEEKARDDAKTEIRVYLSTSGLLFRGCRKRC